MDKLKLTSKKISKTDVSNIHLALRKLNLKVDKTELEIKNLGVSTTNAIKEFQKKKKLPATGKLNKKTIDILNVELFDAHHTNSKTRTVKLHDLLERLSIEIPKEEKQNRATGPETRKAIKSLQKEVGLKADGKISEALLNELHEKVIAKKYTTKTQIGNLQSTLQKALKIAKLPVEITETELKSKKIGASSKKAIQELQTKYNLPATGKLDKSTLDKIQSIAASKGVPVKWMKKASAQDLKLSRGNMSINVTSARVADLQKTLSYLGYKIAAKEYNTQTFGKTTYKAVIAYQKINGLPQTGKIDSKTSKILNKKVKLANPETEEIYNKYRIKGSVRDIIHNRKGNMVLHIHEKLIDGENKEPLMTKKNHSNGFFDIIYSPPIDKITGLPKAKFHLIVKLLDEKDKLITSKIIYNAAKTQWINFNLSGEKYLGDSQFFTTQKILGKALGNVNILTVKETDENKQITELSTQTGLSIDNLMCYLLAIHIANDNTFPATLNAEVFYAFIIQNLPQELPGNLLQATNDWETMPQLVELAKNGIIFSDDQLVEETLNNAISENLVSLKVKINIDSIKKSFADFRQTFTLEKPILIGNANLKLLLDESSISSQNYNLIANQFYISKGINNDFWEAIKADGTIKNKDITDFEAIVKLGNITKNHISTIQFIKKDIGPGKPFNKASDIAKLSEKEFSKLIKDNGNKVPDNIPGDTITEKVKTYAAVLQQRAEFTYPMVSLVSAVKKGGEHPLKKLDEVEKFVDNHEDIDFKTENFDKYLNDNNITIDKSVREEVKVFQRIHKLTPKAAAGQVLIEEGLHSSSRIYALSKTRITTLFEKKGIEPKYAVKLYEQAKSQYAQILGKLMEYTPQIHWGSPQAIIKQTYTKKEIKDALGDIPNLETLFGTLDFCECEHCKSLYGPAAYFTDLLRFLKEHDSLIEQGGNTLNVKDVLFERRPDLGKIKLNCENTNTPMPYIDLVCELLENHIAPKQEDFDFQTTMSASELRAIPQHIRPHAYNTLAEANYPMDTSFNLWQEETRTYLNYLRVPRFELMEAFQDISNPLNKVPKDVFIAAEYFGISSHETKIITKTTDASVVKQNIYWGFNTNQTSVAVSDFMDRTKLTYTELLQLLLVKFVNDPTIPSKSVIERPVDTCDVDTQVITNLNVSKFDIMHRFIRLWRKTGWEMWELDLLLRNTKIGNKTINEDTLINLKKFKLLQGKLKVKFEILLSFYDYINTEERIYPLQANIKVPNLYDQLFRNVTITNPVDTHFKTLPLNAPIILGENTSAPYNGYTPVPTILSALAITQTDFEILKAKTDNSLSLNSLSILLRYTYLAKGLKISITDLTMLQKIKGLANPFNSLQETIDYVETMETIKASGFSLQELDYVINYDAESPLGLREESIIQYIHALRNIIIKNKETIDSLGLNDTLNNLILSFDADALLVVSDVQILIDILPLQNALKVLNEKFINADFSIQETEYILQFANGFDKNNLVSNIKILQENINTLLGQNKKQILSHIANTFNLSDQQATILLENLILPGQAKTLSEILSDKSLLSIVPSGEFIEISVTNFSNHFKAYALLHKVSILLQRIKISTENLEWFIIHHSDLGTLNFSELPITSTITNYYNSWLALYKLISFKSKYPEPENVSMINILEMAIDATVSKEDLLSELSKLTQWDFDELKILVTNLKLKHAIGNLDYTNYKTYWRLHNCIAQAKLTGVNIKTMFLWSNREDINTQSNIAIQTRFAIKSKYENEDWLQKITPLMDDLRDRKRKALVAYHMEESQRNEAPTVVFQGDNIPNPLFWKDANALYKYLLIDVEMSSCQLTSRIKQGISSIQLFVQRCFLNLENRYVQVSQEEKEDVASENAWSQWKWMKVYRIWEANRKVFFYPENWIEPELRDDKSPFFEELENELLQNEITHDNVETAYLSYIHKVDEVANLEVSGVYHERENLNLSEIGYETNFVHVVARTKSIPPIYYYRKYDLNYSTWTAWEKIEVDIEGDQVIPVIYNRKLHLFWLVFMEKAQRTTKTPPAEPSSGSQDAPEPQKMLEIQLAWSIQKEKGWSSKKISKNKMIHPWERPRYAYNLKPYYKPLTNELWLDIYLSTAKEFNDRKFYDPIQNKKVRVTHNYFNETYKPWHSSSFVFNGDVKELNMRGLNSYFHFEIFGSSYDVMLNTTSYEYVHNNFGEDGAKIKKLSTTEDGPRLRLPYGMHFHNTHLTNNKVHSPNNSNLRILKPNGGSPTLLTGAHNPFELVITQQDIQIGAEHPMFYQDHERAFFIQPEWQKRFDQYGQLISSTKKYRFQPFYHPYTTLFLRELNRDGMDGLLNRKLQTKPESYTPKNNFNFSTSYYPNNQLVTVDDEAKKDRLDFSFGGAYSIYNWETFFHGPILIATKLSQNQRFEESMRWFHYIFDPTNIEALPTPQRYWVTKPFYEHNSADYRKQRIENILSNINDDENKDLLKAWRNNPFKPHLIARYRPVAYQRNVVMKYLDNLIAWGDQLFRRDSIESINEASLLYMLAYEILGDRPQKIPNVNREELSFNEIENKLDDFGNASVDVIIEDTLLPIEVVPSTGGSEPMPKIETFYFCIPNNSDLIKYWDTVEDRLFKIRHCMNIEGIVRQLPLFQPPIDPALLVKAAAAGMDLNSVLNDITAGTPHYRFRVIVQKAIDFVNDVKQLGDKLLSVLEKKDVEALSILRSQHEIELLKAIKEVKKKEIDEAVEIVGSMNKAKSSAEERKNYYENKDFINALEAASLILSGGSVVMTGIAGIHNLIASFLHQIPNFSIGISGFGGTPNVTMSVGGGMFASSLQAQGSAVSAVGTMLSQISTMLNTVSGYQRRKEDWDFQGRLADIDIDQIQFQINAAQIRQSIAEKELENQDLQIENAKTVGDYMRNKYTNEQLYNWMITQISTIYFQAYQLAYDMAKKAEKCYQYELGVQNSSYIQFGYWDSLKKGLLSGDKLLHDLRRLETAYIDQNKRELEITKHISLAKIAPLSLMTLKETGQCILSLPEWIFNMDYPGHYMRRIKSVSVSIPCIAGPYTSVNCSLVMIKNEIRIDATLSGGIYEKVDENDLRFKTQLGAISSIATSHGQADSGMFELNFNDERYLPFEGAGVISEWQISMPHENNHFDFASISDMIIHVNYTSRDGGSTLAGPANTQLQNLIPQNSVKLFSLKHEFPNEWHKFIFPSNDLDQEFIVNLKSEHYPFFLRGNINNLKIKKMEIIIESKVDSDFELMMKVTNTDYEAAVSNVSPDPSFNNVHYTTRNYEAGIKPDALGELRFKLKVQGAPANFTSLTSDQIDDLFILCYTTE
ncbi:neuraminidase-like domain-containing protein [Mariniflexile litorale]|uniref:Neuraminidase-like domain-containing protein n=1 Tax=Mariniflexile litorale TaxID=3045158 RepID=A0AAU7EC62_9FLAO|nr:neuraminidase-like domain-containing protein [Mariniflexile sp. KMM 9835]MDQ8213010.1 peptidoglycan-binding protein [Mariniflexile sp. KMM 9835]